MPQQYPQTYAYDLMFTAASLAVRLAHTFPENPSISEAAHAVKFHHSSAQNVWYPTNLMPIDDKISHDRQKSDILHQIIWPAFSFVEAVDMAIGLMDAERVNLPDPQRAAFSLLLCSLTDLVQAVRNEITNPIVG